VYDEYMKLNSLSSLTCYVNDLKKTTKFYEDLGFRLGNSDDTSVTFYLNWFSIKFLAADKVENKEFEKEAIAEPRGNGIYINLKVVDVDEFYQGVLKLGMKPANEPRDWPWGNREFVLRDPDGYKLVFWQKK
jgi:catechol 2,3-dioxygenase-like lactoylglutathione lyase family enzyme